MSYEIPEGDVYRSGSSWASLNDSSYDGVRHYSKRDPAKRNRLSGGLGVLVDRQIYAGGEIGKALVEPFSLRTSPHEKHQTVSGLVGWFCRSGLPLSVVLPPCQSRNVTLLFTFNSSKLDQQIYQNNINTESFSPYIIRLWTMWMNFIFAFLWVVKRSLLFLC